MKETMSLRFLYGTIPGRAVLKVLVHPWVSKVAGFFLSSGMSKKVIPVFIRKNKIDMEGVIVPKNGFASFNDFFSRRRRADSISLKKDQIISPCDGYVHRVKIKGTTVLDVKYSRYSLEDLLQDKGLAEKFEDGTALVFRLTPANYHRYCYPVGGRILFSKQIPGKLHCVRPIALRDIPVFVQNSREYQVLETERFGTVVQMEVGALLVGRIKNHDGNRSGSDVRQGTEKGYFEFGGSTIILLFQKDCFTMDEQLLTAVNDDGELPVRLGDIVGKGNG